MTSTKPPKADDLSKSAPDQLIVPNQGTLQSVRASQGVSHSSSVHIKQVISKVNATIGDLGIKMKDEKLTANTDKRLRDLLTVLDESPFLNDAEIPASYRSILMEVTENLQTIQYYCGEWHKSNKLKRMKQGSATRHKL